uniref:Interferon regulatory factor 2-binding protein 1/2-like zinc finger domain-containing protein n=1 Tax=Amphimedon queenslandica TaxID=400682 RepID=A0A1X7VFV8_AMPQE
MLAEPQYTCWKLSPFASIVVFILVLTWCMVVILIIQNAYSFSYSSTKCFLCEVPKPPWTITLIFREPVCRACCNFEGLDCIVYLIESAKSMTRYCRLYPYFRSAAQYVPSQAQQLAGQLMPSSPVQPPAVQLPQSLPQPQLQSAGRPAQLPVLPQLNVLQQAQRDSNQKADIVKTLFLTKVPLFVSDLDKTPGCHSAWQIYLLLYYLLLLKTYGGVSHRVPGSIFLYFSCCYKDASLS